jgi:hypothetical protein
MRAAAILIVMLAAGCDTASEESTPGAVDTVSPVAEPLVTRTDPPIAETEAGATLVVILEDNTIGMPTEDIAPGPVVFTVRNAGQQLHAFALEGPGVAVRTQDNLANGQEATLEAVLAAGAYKAWCPLHETSTGEVVQFQVAAR